MGQLQSHGLELNLQGGGFSFNGNFIRAFSSSASQFAYNDLNAPAVAAGQLFPVSYEPDFTAELSYQFTTSNKRLRITPSVSYATGYPYGNGKMVWIFDPTTGKPIQLPNDNYVNPGANYYFLETPSEPFNATTNPYIGNLGTNEGNDPNTLRSEPQTFVNLHIEGDITPRLTVILDIVNLLNTKTIPISSGRRDTRAGTPPTQPAMARYSQARCRARRACRRGRRRTGSATVFRRMTA